MPKTGRKKLAVNSSDPPKSPEFLVSIPCQIEPNFHEKWGPLLAGFPIELVYAGFRSSGSEGPKPILSVANYIFDPGSFVEDDSRKRMRYVPRLTSEFYVEVVWNKLAERWETAKYKGDQLIALATGGSFENAMVQTLLVGLHPDEPAI